MKKIGIVLAFFLIIQNGALFSQESKTKQPVVDTVEKTAKEAPAEAEPQEIPEEEAAQTKKVFDMGFSVGMDNFDGIAYSKISFMPEINLGRFGIGLDLTFDFDSNGALFKRDWSSDNWAQAIASKIIYIRHGEKREIFYFRIGTLPGSTLGHGTIMKRFSNMTFYPNVKKIGLNLDLNLNRFGVETMTDNVMDFDIIGGRVYYRPVDGLALAIGLSGVVDLDPKNPTDTAKNIDLTTENSNRIKIAGIDLDIPIIKPGGVFSLLFYTDFVKILNFSAKEGYGTFAGVTGDIIGFEYTGEYRNFSKKFTAPVFDSFYEANRQEILEAIAKKEASEGFLFEIYRNILNIVEARLQFEEEFKYHHNKLYININLLKKLMNKVSFGMGYERREIKRFSDAFKLAPDNSLATIRIGYNLSEKAELVMNYRKSFSLVGVKIEKSESTTLEVKMGF